MKSKAVVVALAIVANVSAQSTNPKKVELAEDLRTLSRVVSVSRDLDDLRPVLLAILDDDIARLREPRGNGTFRWATLQREEDGRVTEEKDVERVSTERELVAVTVTSPRAYRLIITAPSKRNLLSANNRIFIRAAEIDSTDFDGRVTRSEMDVDTWINPGETHGIALTEIGKSVRAKVWLGVESGNKKGAASVALLQAKLVDDPASPAYPAIRRLLDLRRRVTDDEIRKGDLSAAIDEALLSLPGEMDRRRAQVAERKAERSALIRSGSMRGAISAGDATPDVVVAIEEIARLTGGTIEQQSLARIRLQELIELLKPVTGPRGAQ